MCVVPIQVPVSKQITQISRGTTSIALSHTVSDEACSSHPGVRKGDKQLYRWWETQGRRAWSVIRQHNEVHQGTTTWAEGAPKVRASSAARHVTDRGHARDSLLCRRSRNAQGRRVARKLKGDPVRHTVRRAVSHTCTHPHTQHIDVMASDAWSEAWPLPRIAALVLSATAEQGPGTDGGSPLPVVTPGSVCGASSGAVYGTLQTDLQTTTYAWSETPGASGGGAAGTGLASHRVERSTPAMKGEWFSPLQ